MFWCSIRILVLILIANDVHAMAENDFTAYTLNLCASLDLHNPANSARISISDWAKESEASGQCAVKVIGNILANYVIKPVCRWNFDTVDGLTIFLLSNDNTEQNILTLSFNRDTLSSIVGTNKEFIIFNPNTFKSAFEQKMQGSELGTVIGFDNYHATLFVFGRFFIPKP